MNNDTKQCPFCGETIKKVAKKCRFCGTWLPDDNINEQVTSKAIHEVSSTVQTSSSASSGKVCSTAACASSVSSNEELDRTGWLRHYFIDEFISPTWKGNASRKEFGIFFLYYSLINAVIGYTFILCYVESAFDGSYGEYLSYGIYSFPTLFWVLYTPFILYFGWVYICVILRRINDIGYNRWTILLLLIPVLNLIFIIILFVKRSQYDTSKSVVANGLDLFLIFCLSVATIVLLCNYWNNIINIEDRVSLVNDKDYVAGVNDSSIQNPKQEYNASSQVSSCDEFVGTIDGKYRVHMFLDFGKNEGYYYYESQGPDKLLYLKIGQYNNYGSSHVFYMIIKEYDQNGVNTGTFDCGLDGGYYLNGTFTNAQGKEMDFSARSVN